MHITTYLREEGVGTLYTYRLALAVNLYSHRKEELQPTLPDVVWAQDNQFYSWWTSDDKVLLIITHSLRLLGLCFERAKG